MAQFMRESGHSDYPALHQWSVEDPEDFWARLWRFCGIRASKEWDTVLTEGERMQDVQWFSGARLNFAENLLWQDASRRALIYLDEAGRRMEMSYGSCAGRWGASRLALPGWAFARATPWRPGCRIVQRQSCSCWQRRVSGPYSVPAPRSLGSRLFLSASACCSPKFCLGRMAITGEAVGYHVLPS